MSNYDKEAPEMDKGDYVFVETINNQDEVMEELEDRFQKHHEAGGGGNCDAVMIMDCNTVQWILGLMGDGFVRKQSDDGFEPVDPADDDKMATFIFQEFHKKI